MTTTQSTHPYDNYLSNIRLLRQRAANISELAQVALQLTDGGYYDQMKAVVLRPWRFAKDFGSASVDPDLRWPVDRNKANTDSLAETVSDQCMGELVGVGVKPLKCSISTECIRVMTQQGRTGYHLTHQLIYGMVAEQYGCLPVLNLRLRPAQTSIGRLREQFCTNNFYEVSDMVAKVNAHIPRPLQDIFMEQEFVCPNLGYREFLHADWLVQILSWQKPSGCWGTMTDGGRSANSRQKNHSVPVENADSSQQDVIVGLALPTFKTRHLLYEKVLSGDCLAHKTGVAVSALSQYIRFIMSATSAADRHLLGTNYLVEPYRLPQKTATTPIHSEHHERVPSHVVNSNRQGGQPQLPQKWKDSENAAVARQPARVHGAVNYAAEARKSLSDRKVAGREDKREIRLGESQQDEEYDENTEVELDKDDVRRVQSRDAPVEDEVRQNAAITGGSLGHGVVAHPALLAAAVGGKHYRGDPGATRMMFKSHWFVAVAAVFLMLFWFRCMRCFRCGFLLRRCQWV